MITDQPRHEMPRAEPAADTARIWRLLATLSEAGGFAGYVGWTISDRPGWRPPDGTPRSVTSP